MFSSCSKYEEGPAISLRTKKARVANTWQLEKTIYADGSSESPSDGNQTTFEFTKEGAAVYDANGGLSFTGEWEFTHDKENLRVTYEERGVSKTFDRIIIKLKHKEVWLRDDDGNEIHYAPAN